MMKNLKVVGLTGGIASGKSTVAQWYRKWGVPVIDADALAKMVLEPDGEAYENVVEHFGEDILTEGGHIDRQKLGAKVFDSPEQRRVLEGFTHPAIARLARRGLELVENAGEPMAFYEAALLVETGVHKGLDRLVVVSCSITKQLERIIARDGLSKSAAAARIASQYPLSDKVAVADYVIDNEGDLDRTEQQARDVLEKLRRDLEVTP